MVVAWLSQARQRSGQHSQESASWPWRLSRWLEVVAEPGALRLEETCTLKLHAAYCSFDVRQSYNSRFLLLKKRGGYFYYFYVQVCVHT